MDRLCVSGEEDAQLGSFRVGFLRYFDDLSVQKKKINEVVRGDGKGASVGWKRTIVDGDVVGGNKDLELLAGLFPACGEWFEAGLYAHAAAVVVVEGEALGCSGWGYEIGASVAGVDGVVVVVEHAARDHFGMERAGIAGDHGDGTSDGDGAGGIGIH